MERLVYGALLVFEQLQERIKLEECEPLLRRVQAQEACTILWHCHEPLPKDWVIHLFLRQGELDSWLVLAGLKTQALKHQE